MTDPKMLDANGLEVLPGDTVDGDGKVLRLVDCDERGWKLEVEYPEGTELWAAAYLYWNGAAGRDVYRCDDVKVTARGGEWVETGR